MERMTSIELAIKNEQTEMAFYSNEALRSTNPLAKSMFVELAKDEEEHLKRIKILHQRLLFEGSWPENVPIEVRGTDVRNVLDHLVQREGSSRNHDLNDETALEKAIDFETRGSKFYSDLSKACTNHAEKNFFHFLSQIEREHQLSITDSLSFLRDPKSWMSQHERAGLDGAP